MAQRLMPTTWSSSWLSGGADTGRDPATQGERVDISYYNNKQAQQLSQMPYTGGVLASLRWAVFNNHKGRSFFFQKS